MSSSSLGPCLENDLFLNRLFTECDLQTRWNLSQTCRRCHEFFHQSKDRSISPINPVIRATRLKRLEDVCEDFLNETINDYRDGRDEEERFKFDKYFYQLFCDPDWAPLHPLIKRKWVKVTGDDEAINSSVHEILRTKVDRIYYHLKWNLARFSFDTLKNLYLYHRPIFDSVQWQELLMKIISTGNRRLPSIDRGRRDNVLRESVAKEMKAVDLKKAYCFGSTLCIFNPVAMKYGLKRFSEGEDRDLDFLDELRNFIQGMYSHLDVDDRRYLIHPTITFKATDPPRQTSLELQDDQKITEDLRKKLMDQFERRTRKDDSIKLNLKIIQVLSRYCSNEDVYNFFLDLLRTETDTPILFALIDAYDYKLTDDDSLREAFLNIVASAEDFYDSKRAIWREKISLRAIRCRFISKIGLLKAKTFIRKKFQEDATRYEKRLDEMNKLLSESFFSAPKLYRLYYSDSKIVEKELKNIFEDLHYVKNYKIQREAKKILLGWIEAKK